MRPFRHPLLQRALAFVLSAGSLLALVPQADARPAERYADWVRRQATGAPRALLDAALAATLAGAPATPEAFLDRYARLQPAHGRPTGAWFGLDGRSFADALAYLRGELHGVAAPRPSGPVWTTPAPAAPATAPASPAAMAPAAPALRAPVPADGPAPVAPRAEGPARLRRTGGAQPLGP